MEHVKRDKLSANGQKRRQRERQRKEVDYRDTESDRQETDGKKHRHK